MGEIGFFAVAVPEEYGGLGADFLTYCLGLEELGRADSSLRGIVSVSAGLVGKTLVAHGTEEQKRRWIGPTIRGETIWCQGYSEPGSGSDLAAAQTRAAAEDGRFVINGQKIWTTLATDANWIFLLVRTDKQAKKQEGISFLLVDMKTPGITVRPIITIEGGHEVNEVFFDDVKVPADQLVGEENRGWDCAKFLLGNERFGQARVGASR